MIFEIRFRSGVDGIAFVDAVDEDEAYDKFYDDKFAYVTQAIADNNAKIEMPFAEIIGE